MTIKVGDKIPSVKLRHMTKDGPKDITTDEIFKGKKVALFALPGAFTPTCSAKHLPGYVAKLDELKAQGVDLVACLSVNDAWVMKAWAEAHNAMGKITMLADGQAAFSKALGIEVEIPGMGVRARRGLFVIEDGVVKSAEVEQPGKFEVSSAEACMLKVS